MPVDPGSESVRVEDSLTYCHESQRLADKNKAQEVELRARHTARSLIRVGRVVEDGTHARQGKGREGEDPEQ